VALSCATRGGTIRPETKIQSLGGTGDRRLGAQEEA